MTDGRLWISNARELVVSYSLSISRKVSRPVSVSPINIPNKVTYSARASIEFSNVSGTTSTFISAACAWSGALLVSFRRSESPNGLTIATLGSSGTTSLLNNSVRFATFVSGSSSDVMPPLSTSSLTTCEGTTKLTTGMTLTLSRPSSKSKTNMAKLTVSPMKTSLTGTEMTILSSSPSGLGHPHRSSLYFIVSAGSGNTSGMEASKSMYVLL
mmetsp:Transcript_5792/g.17293  ORF Transcript_5792/g.17293 Transcript_5792/m.17293 type:complete len:213 (-) Transcript_5792:301-939(-)